MRIQLVLSIVLAVHAVHANGVEIPMFVIAGQSNAVGYATDSDLLSASLKTVQPNVLYAGSQESPVNWAPLQPPTQTWQIMAGHGFGPELMVGKTISDALGGQQVAEVKFAVNGSALFNMPGRSNWSPEGTLYSQMLARVNDARSSLPTQQPGTTGKVAGFFWMQGETDAGESRTTEQYQADMTNLISRLRTDFANPSLPFVFGLINNAGAGTAAIRQAQINVAAVVPHTFLFDTDLCERVSPTLGDIHFTNQGTVDLGIGFGRGYLSIVPEPSSMMLAGIGLLAWASYLWRKRRSASIMVTADRESREQQSASCSC